MADNEKLAELRARYSYEEMTAHWSSNRNRRVWRITVHPVGAGLADDYATVYAEFTYTGTDQSWNEPGEWRWSAILGKKTQFAKELYIEAMRLETADAARPWLAAGEDMAPREEELALL